MIKKLAVVLRGHYRTWDYNHKIAFQFYDSVAEEVDYYFVSWKIHNFSIRKMLETFSDNNKNLVKWLLLYPDPAIYNGWIGPSWSNWNIIPYINKQIKEKGEYDAIADTRPDIIYKKVDYPGPIFPDTLYTTNHVMQKSPAGDLHLGVEDHFFMSTYDVYKTLNQRFTVPDSIGCHNTILQYAKEYGITTTKLNWILADIVRPNAFKEIPDPNDYFQVLSDYTMPYRLIPKNWVLMSSEEKIEMLDRYGIQKEDYNTASANARI